MILDFQLVCSVLTVQGLLDAAAAASRPSQPQPAESQVIPLDSHSESERVNVRGGGESDMEADMDMYSPSYALGSQASREELDDLSLELDTRLETAEPEPDKAEPDMSAFEIQFAEDGNGGGEANLDAEVEESVVVPVAPVAAAAEAAGGDRKRQRLREGDRAVIGRGGGGAKLHVSPHDILRPISPPGCLITLAKTDHRFKATWRRHLACETWIDTLSNMTFSTAFNLSGRATGTTASWQEALKTVHACAWDKWGLAQDILPELQLPDGESAQVPGEIGEEVFQ